MLVSELMLPVFFAPQTAAMITTAWVYRLATSVRLSAFFAVGYGFVEAHLRHSLFCIILPISPNYHVQYAQEI